MGVTISRKNKLPDLLNTKRSKSKTKLNLEFRNVLIHYINSLILKESPKILIRMLLK
jgi:hypothetical protein